MEVTQYNTGIGWATPPTGWYVWHCTDCGWIRYEYVLECTSETFPFKVVGCPWCGRRVYERFWDVSYCPGKFLVCDEREENAVQTIQIEGSLAAAFLQGKESNTNTARSDGDHA